MLASGSRISHHLRECDHFQLGLGFYTSRILQLSSLVLKPPSLTTSDVAHRLSSIGAHTSLYRLSSCCTMQSQSSPRELSILSDCFSDREGTLETEGLSSSVSVAGGIVALGKFDALHIGHRELAIQASKVGTPFLMSFVGMAEVLGWEPRVPIVAKCDRQRVLSSWAPYCSYMIPLEFEVEFSSVRSLSPQQFVEKLAKELHVRGVVAGENYRFGFRAAGDSSALVRLCGEYGIGACIIRSVMDKNQDFIHSDSSNAKERGQVSSTRVRHALAAGDMKYVTELLGRRHRLILAKDNEGCRIGKHSILVPKSCSLNLAPGDGVYRKCFIITAHEKSVPCEVEIDESYFRVRTEVDIGNSVDCSDTHFLRIEFG